MTPGEHACNELKVTLKEYFESRMGEYNRRLESLNDLNKHMAEDRAKFVPRDLHDKLQSDLSKIENTLTALTTKISQWFIIVAGAYGLIQIGLSALFYHLFHQPKP
jgi:uncharacterized protein YydD (DUF2326 family)